MIKNFYVSTKKIEIFIVSTDKIERISKIENFEVSVGMVENCLKIYLEVR